MRSPIEDSFLSSLLEVAPTLGARVYLFHSYRSMDEPPDPHPDDQIIEAEGAQKFEMIVFRQARMHGYKLDFLVSIKAMIVVALDVECDGHEWHERTQQQAAYDRARDRDLLKHGIQTIRYTGSEIHRDSNHCAVDAMQVLLGAHDAIAFRVKDATEELVRKVHDEMTAENEASVGG